MWNHLRARRFCGKKFRRQHGIGRYVVDFYCPELQLVIEVDGDTHCTEREKRYDHLRDEFLRANRLQVFRFSNDEVLLNLSDVLGRLKDVVHHPSTPPR